MSSDNCTRQRTISDRGNVHRSGSYLACDWLSQLGGEPLCGRIFQLQANDLAARQELGLAGDHAEVAKCTGVSDGAPASRSSGDFAVKAMWPAFASLFTQVAADSEGRFSGRPLGQRVG